MRTKYKKWAPDYLENHKNVVHTDFYIQENLEYKKIQLEIGGGKGMFITELAKRNPSILFLMIERVPSIAAVAAKKIVENNLQNVHIICNDFVKIMCNIPNESIDTIYLNFSDPWPKRKHIKRRLTFQPFIEQYQRILKKHGQIVMKTDQKYLYEYSQETMKEKKFKIIVSDQDYKLNCDDILTEYETKFRQKNNSICKLIAEKI